MAVFELTFRAETLDFDQNVTVLLPEPGNLALAETGKPFRGELPVLYLLHGYSDDHTSWLRRSSIERYLTMDSTRPLVCVCPSVQNSFYTDMEYGWKYYTYLTEELPRLLSRWIRISSKREDTFIAGLSMGGYGAYKIALSHPERFAAAASFSGVLDIAKSGRDNPARDGAAYNVFGKNRSELQARRMRSTACWTRRSRAASPFRSCTPPAGRPTHSMQTTSPSATISRRRK